VVDVDGDYVDDVWGRGLGHHGRGWWWWWGEGLEDDGRGRGRRDGADDDWRRWGRGWDDGGDFAADFPYAGLRGFADVEVLFVSVFAFAGIH
jgi:hypothetical protein